MRPNSDYCRFIKADTKLLGYTFAYTANFKEEDRPIPAKSRSGIS